MKARRFCEWSVLLTLMMGLSVRVSAAPPDIVLYASDATVKGAWSKTAASGAAGGQLLLTADNGWAATDTPLASPNDSVEATFTAPANTPYHLWLRLRATADTKYNDSVWAQFSDATDSNGTAIYQIGSGSGLLINLENCFACGVAGWGWQDKAYWLNQASTISFSTGGSHTIRVQTREDGVQVDQIVLSPSTYMVSAPGQVMNDSTIVPRPVAAASTPFFGTPAAVPGTIQIQDFDSGGEGVAYHDTTAGNTGGAYRPGDVDLEPSADGGSDVGWTAAGEWLNYTVNVAAAGSYAVMFRVASNGQGGSFHLEMSGTNVSGAVTVPNTNGWQSWQSVTKTVTLASGQQVARLVMDTAGDAGIIGNLDSMAFTAVTAVSTGITPYTGTAAAIPGRIEAANFDNGVEGVAYHDTTPGNAGVVYRATDVDLQSSTDGGFNIGWIGAGEWVTYTVNVASAGSYTAQLRIASPGGDGLLHLGFDASNVWTAVPIPSSESFQIWTTVSVPVTLSAGQQVMKLFFDTRGFNVASITVVGATTTGGSPGAPTSPSVADGSVAVSVTPDLSWQAAGATSYDLRLDTVSPPTGLWGTSLPSNSFSVSGLNNATKYYWQVVAKNSAGSTAGPVWSFTTAPSAAPPPNSPNSPGVADGSVGVTIPAPLSWQAAGATSYDLRLDNVNPPTSLWGIGISSTSFAASPLNSATKYYWQVVAKNSSGSTAGPVWSFTTAAPAPPVVPPPTAPNSPGVADGSVGVTIPAPLSWQAAGATSYDLRLDNVNPPTSLWGIGVSTTSFAVSPLNNSTKYYWQVVAKNSSGSTAGPVWSFTTAAPVVPPPTAPNSPGVADGSVGVTIPATLSWQAAGATSYDVRLDSVNPPTSLWGIGISSTSFAVSPLNSATKYYWQVVAKNSSGSTAGPVWSFTTAAPVVPPPTAPNSPGVADGSVGVTIPATLSWQAAGATSYDVRLDSVNPPTSLWGIGISSTSFAVSPLNGATKYYWQVVAKNSAGSTAGPVWSFTTASGAAPPTAPNSPGVADGSVGVTIPAPLSWQAAGATSYDLRLDSVNPPTSLWGIGLSSTSFAASPLNPSTKYYWQVVAKNSAGSTAGPVWSFTTAASPTPPASSSSFRMMTWNIHHGYTTANVYNLQAQVQLMVAQNPDVIALQEVQTWDENQPPKLKSLLEQLTGQTWTLVWAPVINTTGGTEGNVILTRLPVVASTFQQLHATSDWTVLLANRSVAQATVLVNSVPVNVFATHLDYANTSYRTIQEQQLMAWLWNFSGPRLTGGDFNSWWGESWITTMETQHTDTWHDVTGLQDLGYTVNQAVRFDYVFRAMDNNWRVTPTNIFVPVTSISDHNPVVADFRVQ